MNNNNNRKKEVAMNQQEWENEQRAELDWLNANPYNHYQYPAEFEIVKISQDGKVYVNCNRCRGTGSHSFNTKDGDMCLKCKGAKIMPDALMTNNQIALIRELFKSVRHKMTIDEQEELIAIMKSAIDETKRINRFWASQTIDELKSLKERTK